MTTRQQAGSAIAGGPQVLPTIPRIDAVPAPVVIHIVAAAVYALFGAFQFPARLRRRHPGWHRRSGRVLVGTGVHLDPAPQQGILTDIGRPASKA
jgi:hypothetical protein